MTMLQRYIDTIARAASTEGNRYVGKPAPKKKNAAKQASFSLVIAKGNGIGEHKEGDTLTQERHIADYLKQFAIALAESDTAKEAIGNATTDQVMTVVKTVDLSQVEKDDDYDTVVTNMLVAAVGGARFAAPQVSDLPPVQRIRASTGTAGLFGDMFPENIIKDVNTDIEAIQKGDAAPVHLAASLYAFYADKVDDQGTPFFAVLPPVGTRYRPHLDAKRKTPGKPPIGYRLPNDNELGHGNMPVYQGPYDLSETQAWVEGVKKWVPIDWVSEFCGKKLCAAFYDRAHMLDRCLRAKDAVEDAPEGIKKLVVGKNPGEKVKILTDEAAEASFQYTRRVRMTRHAFELIQGKMAIEARWPETKVELFGVAELRLPVEQATRKRKPYCLVTTTPHPTIPNTFNRDVSPPYVASKIRGAKKRIAELSDEATLSNFLSPKERGTPAESTEDTRVTAKVHAIQSIDDFELYINECVNYVRAGKMSLLLDKCKGPKGGMFASSLAYLKDITNDVLEVDGVADKAIAWDALQLKAQGEIDKNKAA